MIRRKGERPFEDALETRVWFRTDGVKKYRLGIDTVPNVDEVHHGRAKYMAERSARRVILERREREGYSKSILGKEFGPKESGRGYRSTCKFKGRPICEH